MSPQSSPLEYQRNGRTACARSAVSVYLELTGHFARQFLRELDLPLSA
ncbi:MAG: hypothetical protein K0Q92_367 [Steroidobacteraceae bacterium]|jgi:hypothetical protein|nr:hypothetical protein [Steroidobacteraceae bacterium]